jgi:Protein of unknown function (DUF3079)
MESQAVELNHRTQTDKPGPQGKTATRPKVPLHTKNPERICWGRTKYCPANALVCGNGTIRTQHPSELFGKDWMDWSLDSRDSEA